MRAVPHDSTVQRPAALLQQRLLALLVSLSLSLFSVSVSAYTTSSSPFATRQQNHKHGRISTELQYINDEDETTFRITAAAETLTTTTSEPGTKLTLSVQQDYTYYQALAFAMGWSEPKLQAAFQQWRQTFRHAAARVPDARASTLTSSSLTLSYQQWTRNFVLQQVSNRAHGTTFQLNEFGDWTNEEYEQYCSQQHIHMERILSLFLTETQANVLPLQKRGQESNTNSNSNSNSNIDNHANHFRQQRPGQAQAQAKFSERSRRPGGWGRQSILSDSAIR